MCKVRRVIDARMGQGEREQLSCQDGRIDIGQAHVGLSASVPLEAHFYLMSG